MDERAIGWWMGTCERARREGGSDTGRITHVAAMMAVCWVSEGSHVLQLVVACVQGGGGPIRLYHRRAFNLREGTRRGATANDE